MLNDMNNNTVTLKPRTICRPTPGWSMSDLDAFLHDYHKLTDDETEMLKAELSKLGLMNLLDEYAV